MGVSGLWSAAALTSLGGTHGVRSDSDASEVFVVDWYDGPTVHV